jgi:hypothetical protein
MLVAFSCTGTRAVASSCGEDGNWMVIDLPGPESCVCPTLGADCA